ncbi:hypothetical protein BHWA1_01730 [Brachyspira hyodysenteriae WA1]|uniref:Uncharacterized protein n=1 Tax=Brachyspira hyodysenteriae (strain ATCC 49526 / WA1) TaxID=565034 RepID=A0A3B6V9Q0_BRAHW|nr:hypothetical protein BHWA1_01730 [Brachyspira hyodysenteriae WA1]
MTLLANLILELVFHIFKYLKKNIKEIAEKSIFKPYIGGTSLYIKNNAIFQITISTNKYIGIVKIFSLLITCCFILSEAIISSIK